MSNGLIIGYGNPLRGDDGIGSRLAEVLATRLPHVTVLPRHQLTVELSEDIARASWVIFIDADATQPVCETAIHPAAPDTHLPHVFSHHLSPGALLACAQQFFGSAPRTHLFAIGVSSLEPGAVPNFTPAEVDRLAGQVMELAQSLDASHTMSAHA